VHGDPDISRHPGEQERSPRFLAEVVKPDDSANPCGIDVLDSTAIEHQLVPTAFDQSLQRFLKFRVIGGIDESLELN
jgi:hypothetical protein